MTAAERKKRQRDNARKDGKCLVCCKRKAVHGSKCRKCYEATVAWNYRRRGLTEKDAKSRKKRKH